MIGKSVDLLSAGVDFAPEAAPGVPGVGLVVGGNVAAGVLEVATGRADSL
jgi:hypothetical protein